eukprot:CAMPEP_0185596384 /NCGR_PEP_ID=MMETSP0434-20130131/80727_1 /TAXON_ID=626734 ORGANISM="Favella taraikaensis, Strain Fe Narragansett Bay" /NCGR_SAMPLE_ID=MMETSP0434 /ASSEMBLY_ACC=CAM_ASM_000379 /LENGTH=169 /DNA_ID=CAMNT_0028224879 /DNA_START=312 /DNA_END=821 /DNA_ORIENTATION=-
MTAAIAPKRSTCCSLADSDLLILVEQGGDVDDGSHCAEEKHLLQERVNTGVNSLSAACKINFAVALLEFFNLGQLVAESLDGADVGKRLLSDIVHVALLSLDSALQVTHPALVEGCEKDEWDDAAEGHTSQDWRNKQHDDQRDDDLNEAASEHREVGTQGVLHDLDIRV